MQMTSVHYVTDNPDRLLQHHRPVFLSSLWGDVAIRTEASDGPNAQLHIP